MLGLGFLLNVYDTVRLNTLVFNCGSLNRGDMMSSTLLMIAV